MVAGWIYDEKSSESQQRLLLINCSTDHHGKQMDRQITAFMTKFVHLLKKNSYSTFGHLKTDADL